MATARDCFNENLKLIGTPPAAEFMIQWNLSNGLRMLADQVTQLQADQRRMEGEIQTLLQHARAQR